jgi:integrase/recombinase XerD
MTLDKLIEGYHLYCQAEGKSQHTIRWYMGKLAVFLEYLNDHGHVNADDMDAHTIRAFVVHLQQSVKADELNPCKPTRSQSLSPKTIQGYVRTIKAFFSWAHREGFVKDNPAARVKVPKAPATVVPTFTESQVRQFLSVIDRRKPIGFRDYCITLTFLDTGIRLSELVGLELPAVNLEEGHFRVLGKGSKERIVPIGASLQKALWKYINRYRPEPVHPTVTGLFLTRDGRALAARTVYCRIREYGEKARLVGVRCSPHTFRHTFAKSFLLNGGDVFTLQKILGHTSLAVVRMYVQLASEDVQVQHRRYSPVDWMKLRI